jgi:hypothetical protein
MINFFKFFEFMTIKEKWLMALGTIGAIIASFLLPCMAIAMGSVTNAFSQTDS